MIYLLFIKTFRIWSFLTFFGSALVFGVENAAGLESIANLDAWSDLKFPIVFSLGFWIVINLGAIFFTRFDQFLWSAYFDNMFTYKIEGEIRETLGSNSFWNYTWPQLRGMDNFEVYYNDPSCTKRLNRLF
jgi:hypothetical protein